MKHTRTCGRIPRGDGDPITYKKKRIFEEPERKENESSHHDSPDVISARGASIIANLLVNDKR